MADGGSSDRPTSDKLARGDAMRIVLDGNDIEIRAYLASQIGPTRRPFGRTRGFPIAAGVPTRLAQCHGDFVLFVSIESSVSTTIAVSKQQSPSANQDVTVAFTALVTFLDLVLLPGEELWVRPLVATTMIKSEQPF